MKLIYHPDGQETPTEWEFKLEKLRSSEIEAIEKRTGGWAYRTEFREQLLKGSALARRALLWVFLRRAHPFLKFEDVDFADGEVEIEADGGELVDQRAELLKLAETGIADPDEVEIALAVLDTQIAAWQAAHPEQELEPEGKAR